MAAQQRSSLPVWRRAAMLARANLAAALAAADGLQSLTACIEGVMLASTRVFH
jgi:hypothetical protein